jgi:hypothetical protein
MSRQAGGADNLASLDIDLIAAMSPENQRSQVRSWRSRDTSEEAELGDVHAQITSEGTKLTGKCHSASRKGDDGTPTPLLVPVRLGLIDEGLITREHRHPMRTSLCACQRRSDGKVLQDTESRACALNQARNARTIIDSVASIESLYTR